MKKIKGLILMILLCMLCSFTNVAAKTTGKFTVDFKVDLSDVNNGAKTTTHEFSYGQKFVFAYVKEVIVDPRDATYYVAKKNKSELFFTINTKEDLDMINNPKKYFPEAVNNKCGLIPIDNYNSSLDYFYQVSDIADFSFIELCYTEDSDSVVWILAEQIKKSLNATATDASIDNVSPVIDNYHGMFITNINNPLPETEIRKHIKAIDDVDGDISNKIQVTEDLYTPNKTKIGDYRITYTVADSAGNSATLFVHVKVVDTDRPVFSGPKEVISPSSKLLTYDEIIGKITVSDNYDKNITIVDNDVDDYHSYYNSHINKGAEVVDLVKDFNVSFSCQDSSGNKASYGLVIHVVDDIKPIISGNSSYVGSIHKQISIDEVKNGLTVKDNSDKTLTKQNIVLKNDTYTTNYNKIGNYQMVFTVTDKNGNVSNDFVVNISVEDHVKPVFYVDKFIINCDPSIKLTNQEIFEILRECNTIDFDNITDIDKQIIVTYDNYQNSMEEGTYNMGLKVSYDDGNVQDLTLTINKQIFEPVVLPWYTRIYYSIVQYTIKINNFIDGIFTKIQNFFYNLFH